MHLKRNPTPVASNPRGLCSDRIAYRKYIHSVQEVDQKVDQRKTGNGYPKLCKTDSEKSIENKNTYTSNVTSKATAKKLSSRGNMESPKPSNFFFSSPCFFFGELCKLTLQLAQLAVIKECGCDDVMANVCDSDCGVILTNFNLIILGSCRLIKPTRPNEIIQFIGYSCIP